MVYPVVCWLIPDPVHVVFHMLDVPIWADRLVIMLMAAGVPAVVIFTGGPETHGRSPAWTVDPQATEHSDYWRLLW